jgi:8-oxo-dGTP diphosphatase
MTRTSPILQADPERARQAGHGEVVDVAVGILIRPDGHFLMTSRPQGKAYAGYWEFPGGKFEPGEVALEALRRELLEELGITVLDGHVWREQLVDYPHAIVRLFFCKITRWQGELQCLEGQSYSWERLAPTVAPILPGSVPVLVWLSEDHQTTDLGADRDAPAAQP